MTTMTKHAAKRAQQRGIPPVAIDLLEQFGCRSHDHRGAVLITLNKRARSRITQICGKAAAQINLSGLYAVLSINDEAVITVGHQTRRMREAA